MPYFSCVFIEAGMVLLAIRGFAKNCASFNLKPPISESIGERSHSTVVSAIANRRKSGRREI
jgi:hypothetical protein